MTQRELNRAVAAATDESVETIANMGFQLVEVPDDPDPDILCSPLVVDWDVVEFRRAA